MNCKDCFADSVSLSSRMDKSAFDLAQKNPDQFLTQYVFSNLIVDEFRYGKKASGGKTDTSNMISGYITEPAGSTQLAIHVNSVVTASGLQNNAMTIHVEKFHLTARSIASQKTIDSHGPSTITASKSIHIGVNQPSWGPSTNVQNLQHEIGVDPVAALRGYDTAHVVSLTKDFKTKVELSIHQLLGGNVVVKWTGDKSFP